MTRNHFSLGDFYSPTKGAVTRREALLRYLVDYPTKLGDRLVTYTVFENAPASVH